MYSGYGLKPLPAVAMFSVMLFPPVALRGQTPAPARVEIYGGYAGILPVNSQVHGNSYKGVDNINATISIAGFFTRHIGAQIEGEYFNGNSGRGVYGQCAPACESRDQMYYALQGGPILQHQWNRFTPFVHVLGGGVRVNGPYMQPLTWGVGGRAGGGVDYVLPWFHDLFAFRIFQGDISYSHVDYGTAVNGVHPEGVGKILAVKGEAGLVVRFTDRQPAPAVSMTCQVQPEVVLAGDPAMVTATPMNLNAKKAVYTWSATGGVIQSHGPGGSIATTGLAPGTYVVSGHVREGAKATQQASCTASFTVKEPERPVPPSVTCSADPATGLVGADFDIKAAARSPQNRPMTYSYSATAGIITGTGPNAMLATPGVSAGPITVTCHVVDDAGEAASASTAVLIMAPPPPPPVASQRTLCGVSFSRDRKHPERVDNEAKACLDDISLALNREPAAKVVLVGKQMAGEPTGTAEARSKNVSLYLIQEKGIDASRIELRASPDPGKDVDDVLVPDGASYIGEGTVVNPNSVHPVGQPYGAMGKPKVKQKAGSGK